MVVAGLKDDLPNLLLPIDPTPDVDIEYACFDQDSARRLQDLSATE